MVKCFNLLILHFHPAEMTDVRKSPMAQASGNMTNVKEEFEQHNNDLASTFNHLPDYQYGTVSSRDQEQKTDIVSIVCEMLPSVGNKVAYLTLPLW